MRLPVAIVFYRGFWRSKEDAGRGVRRRRRRKGKVEGEGKGEEDEEVGDAGEVEEVSKWIVNDIQSG